MKKIFGFLLTALLCGAVTAQQSYTWTGKPIFDIEVKRNNQALGTIKIELFPKIAPKHTRSFDSLVSVKFYDTVAFHRVIPGFVIQGGDPNSRHGNPSTWGQGDPSQPTVPAEFTIAKHLRGILSGARQANNINSYTSQFFICVANLPSLDGKYSIFGRVLAGMSVVDTIVSAPRNTTNDMPLQKIEMFVTRNGSNDSVPVSPVLVNPVHNQNFDPLPNVVQLTWNKVSDALFYELQVALDTTYSLPHVDLKLNSTSYSLYNPYTACFYYWRVRANNGGHLGAWSQYAFSTYESTTGTSPAREAPAGPQVFPNPSAGVVNFRGVSPGQRISVFNALGSKVVEVTAESTAHTVDLREFGAGIYLYQVDGGALKRRTGTILVR